jgi:hypothetical protein
MKLQSENKVRFGRVIAMLVLLTPLVHAQVYSGSLTGGTTLLLSDLEPRTAARVQKARTSIFGAKVSGSARLSWMIWSGLGPPHASISPQWAPGYCIEETFMGRRRSPDFCQ